MKTGLVTDSTADLPTELVEKHHIEVIPSILVIDGESFADGKDITREAFYARMPSMKSPATTAAPSAGSFMERYEKLLTAGAENIFSIHPAASLSGIFNAARLAAESFGKRVHVIDSGQLSLGCGFQIIIAAEAIAQSAGADEINRLLENSQKQLKVFAILDTLEYLRRSGRVSWAKTRFGNLFKLKPMIELTYGRVENIGAVRTTRLANIRLLEILRAVGPIERLAILHTNAEARAHQFLKQYAPDLPTKPLIINVTTAIGAHLGPNGLGFAAVRE